ncbi:MAG: WD40 repeat domain-containing protein [Mucilaginibacter polytrichastri]|nr:WD40 repeat domain-containing protein [Mucilaginibacter polytrichastri]
MEISLHSTYPGHSNPVYAVTSSLFHPVFYSAGNDKGIVEWGFDHILPLKLLQPVPASVYTMKIEETTRSLFAGLRNGRILHFGLEEGKLLRHFGHSTAGIFDLELIRSKKELLAADENGLVSVWNFSGDLLHKWQASREKIRAMAIFPEKDLLAIGCNEGIIRLYDLRDFSPLHEFRAHSMGVTSLAFSAEGDRLFSGSRDAHLKVWDLGNYSALSDFAAHYFSIYKILFHPQKPVFATVSRDKSFKIWDANEYRLLKNISAEKGYPSHRLSVNDACWAENGSRFITVGDDKMVLSWDVSF